MRTIVVATSTDAAAPLDVHSESTPPQAATLPNIPSRHDLAPVPELRDYWCSDLRIQMDGEGDELVAILRPSPVKWLSLSTATSLLTRSERVALGSSPPSSASTFVIDPNALGNPIDDEMEQIPAST
jgi:hypothetical protein